ncbi:MAG TPA: hypothetical protein PK014_05780 [Thermoanaerobaculia bacterium]|nr:hypothetical protein [Thermoanaerobaculia bacterium]HUM29605.1 hypothetical protein [Thermoanaerobaculia bacterium]HXK67256.1 hypothetical protein [Thermoanaerobaculia bacterium]
MSTEFTPLTFGFALPSEKDFGSLAKELLQKADSNMRSSRSRALLYLIPSILFYLVFSAGISLILWSLDLDLPSLPYLGVVAGAFLIMAGLGKHYQMEATADLLEADFRLHQVMLLQAFIVKVITAIFFIYPYRIVRNLSRLFPRQAMVNPQIINIAVNLAAALDVPVRAKEIRTILPGSIPPAAMEEALRLLKWAGMAETLPRGGDVFIYPSPGLDSMKSSMGIPYEVLKPFSALLAEGTGTPMPAEAPGTSDQPVPAPMPSQKPVSHSPIPPSASSQTQRPTATSSPVTGHVVSRPTPNRPAAARASTVIQSPPVRKKPKAQNPLRLLAIVTGVALIAFIGFKIGMSFYRKLPVRAQVAALPIPGDVQSITVDPGRLYLGREHTVEVYRELGSVEEDSFNLSHLRRLWGSPGMDSATGEDKVTFDRIDWAQLDPEGEFLLVHGHYTFDPGRVTGTGNGFVVIDLEDHSYYTCNQFDNLPVKGWWDAGRILVTRPAILYEEGGGQRLDSDNLAGTVMAIDVRSGEQTTLMNPKERYFARAGWEQGKPVYFAADWETDLSNGVTTFTFTEYLDRTKRGSFSWKTSDFHPILRQSELDPTGKYWVLCIEYSPSISKMDEGWKSSLWVFSRNGIRCREITSRDGNEPFFLQAFLHQNRSMLTFLRDYIQPEFEAMELVRD